MTTNLQKNPKKQFVGSKQAILQKEPNKHVLNNTTVQHLGNGEEPIEVFPPEIFFKGKLRPELPALFRNYGILTVTEFKFK